MRTPSPTTSSLNKPVILEPPMLLGPQRFPPCIGEPLFGLSPVVVRRGRDNTTNDDEEGGRQQTMSNKSPGSSFFLVLPESLKQTPSITRTRTTKRALFLHRPAAAAATAFGGTGRLFPRDTTITNQSTTTMGRESANEEEVGGASSNSEEARVVVATNEEENDSPEDSEITTLSFDLPGQRYKLKKRVRPNPALEEGDGGGGSTLTTASWGYCPMRLKVPIPPHILFPEVSP